MKGGRLFGWFLRTTGQQRFFFHLKNKAIPGIPDLS